ncbi:MAG: hypothetical protein Q4D71_10675, partial [Oscillospiraceae bacterium]|nr:hypothetical protein [Oscillospiraceae bacterium]
EDGWYYLKASGYRATNEWVKDSVGWHWLGTDGRMLTNGWAKDSAGWMWMDANGNITKSKWIKYEDGWYYLKASGYRATNEWCKDSVGWHWIEPNGRMLTNGWAKDSAGWCWMDANGNMTYSKWVKVGEEWFYVKSSGYRAQNEWCRDSQGWHWMQEDGKMLTNGWAKDSKGWCWLDGKGNMVTNKWIETEEGRYYVNAYGYRVVGEQVIGGTTYTFDSDGRLMDYQGGYYIDEAGNYIIFSFEGLKTVNSLPDHVNNAIYRGDDTGLILKEDISIDNIENLNVWNSNGAGRLIVPEGVTANLYTSFSVSALVVNGTMNVYSNRMGQGNWVSDELSVFGSLNLVSMCVWIRSDALISGLENITGDYSLGLCIEHYVKTEDDLSFAENIAEHESNPCVSHYIYVREGGHITLSSDIAINTYLEILDGEIIVPEGVTLILGAVNRDGASKDGRDVVMYKGRLIVNGTLILNKELMLTKNGDPDNDPPFLCVGDSGEIRGRGSIIICDDTNPQSFVSGIDFSEFNRNGSDTWIRDAEIENFDEIISVSTDDMILFEGTGTSAQSVVWDENGNASYVSYMSYNIWPSVVNVVTTDKTFIGDPWTVTRDVCEYYGLDFDKWNQKNMFFAVPQQSYENQWGIGTYHAAGTMFNVPVTYNVEIIENPVISLEVADVAIEENDKTQCGEMVAFEDGSQRYVNYEGYNVWPQAITITATRGTVTGNLDEIREWIMSTYGVGWNAVSGWYMYTGQYENPWGLGVHQAMLSFMGRTSQFNVEIVRSE